MNERRDNTTSARGATLSDFSNRSIEGDSITNKEKPTGEIVQEEIVEALDIKAASKRRPRPTLSEDILLQNISSLPKLATQLHLSGNIARNDVLKDVNQILLSYQKWAHDIFPHASLLDFVDKVADLHSKKRFRSRLDDIRAEANPTYADSLFTLSSFYTQPSAVTSSSSTTSQSPSDASNTSEHQDSSSSSSSSSVISEDSESTSSTTSVLSTTFPSFNPTPLSNSNPSLSTSTEQVEDNQDMIEFDAEFFNSTSNDFPTESTTIRSSSHQRYVLSDDEE